MTQEATEYVYLIQNGEMYKIGKSRRPSVRAKSVLGGASSVVLHVIPSANARLVERSLQWRFYAKLIKPLGREWFRLSPEDVASIRRLGRTDTVDDLPPELRGTKPNSGMTTILVRVPLSVLFQLDELATRNDRTIGQEIARAIRFYLSAHKGLLEDFEDDE